MVRNIYCQRTAGVEIELGRQEDGISLLLMPF